MANSKISALTAATTPLAGTEVLPIVQSSTTVKATIANVQAAPVSAGTANGVQYLNASKVPTTGSALQFDGTNLLIGETSAGYSAANRGLVEINGSSSALFGLRVGTVNKGYLYHEGTNLFLANDANGAAIFSTNASEKMRLDAAGNLGLSATPSASTACTNIELPYGATLSSRSNTAAPQFAMMSNAVGNWYAPTYKINGYATQYTQQGFDGKHSWYTAPSGTAGNAITFTQAMTLDASGNLLLGTTSTVLGGQITNTFTAAAKNGMVFNETGNTSGASFIYFALSGSAIGNISRVASTSAVAYTTTSDYRLKEFVSTVTGAGERIDALNPIEFDWKSDGSRARGFFAHEFQEVYANSVTGEKDAVNANGKPVYQAMQASTAEVVADLVAEIQSLRKRLAALEAT
jgi:hypothetical protein